MATMDIKVEVEDGEVFVNSWLTKGAEETGQRVF